jgi:hypothetical protein
MVVNGNHRYRCARVIATLLCGLVCIIIGGTSVAAAAMVGFGSEGTGADQFIEPNGVAINQSNGDAYIADRNNDRVEKFSSTGNFLMAWGWGVADGITKATQTCTTTCFMGLPGSGTGQLSGPEGIAVDSNPLSPAYEDVYVEDRSDLRVEKFGPDGIFILMFGGEVNRTNVKLRQEEETNSESVTVSEAEENICTAASNDICQAGTEGTHNGQFQGLDGRSIAVGADGNVYVGDENRVQEFNSEGAYKAQIPLSGAGSIRALAVASSSDNIYVESTKLEGVHEYDSSGAQLQVYDEIGQPKAIALGALGDVFVDNGPDENHQILEYDSSGSEISSMDSDTEGGERGVAFSEITKELYVLNRGTVRLVTPPPPGPLVVSESVTDLLPTTASLDAIVNSEGKETTYHFEYGPTISYGTSLPITDMDIGSSFEDQGASAELTSLLPDTTYHYRIVATDSADHTSYSPDETFTTLSSAGIDSESVSDVTSTSATLVAQIDPLGAGTKYSFEYGPTMNYGVIISPVEPYIGSGFGEVTVNVNVNQLRPSVPYHYRVVASNERGGVRYVVDGSDRVFTTQAVGLNFTLPDGRVWEMVSPPNKEGAGLEPITLEGGLIQSSEGGNAIAYIADSPIVANPAGNRSPEYTEVISKRGTEGWESRDLATPHEIATGIFTNNMSEYRAFSNDLSLGLVEPKGEELLSPGATEKTPYLRKGLSEEVNENYTPLVTANDVPPNTKFGGGEGVGRLGPEFVTGTSKLTNIVLSSGIALTTSPITQDHNLYEWTEGAGGDQGQIRLVSALPSDGGPAPNPALGDRNYNVRHAISDDGSRLVWSAEGSGSVPIFLRDMVAEETLQVNAGLEAEAKFQIASSEGSKVFFTAGALPSLYAFELTSHVGEKLAGKVTDLTDDKNPGESADIKGVVLGASEDGSDVYFVAGGVLSNVGNGQGETAVSGANNLYMQSYNGTEWTPPRFIAGLSSGDSPEWEDDQGRLGYLTARASPDGRYFAFMSERDLTGYDNIDANSDQPDEEVYLYDANSGNLVCASCSPTGARPVGVDDSGEPGLLVDRIHTWSGHWMAGSIPGWTSIEFRALYQSRYLSNRGRLFFTSPDNLVPQDANGKEDVYEYEPRGDGSCEDSNSFFSERSEGCVDLVSSGTSSEESAFLDASGSGDNVFFLTAARLLPQDDDDSFDIYDAHECTSGSPCLAVPTALPPECETADACRAAPSPQPAIFGEPPSATFSGAGNGPSPALKPAVKVKVKMNISTRAEKLSIALKGCKKVHQKAKRTLCQVRARKRYGTKKHGRSFKKEAK